VTRRAAKGCDKRSLVFEDDADSVQGVVVDVVAKLALEGREGEFVWLCSVDGPSLWMLVTSRACIVFLLSLILACTYGSSGDL
jgi:hypothetical protein